MPKLSIELPHVGESVVEGVIDRWLKQPGDQIQKYDPLVEVVTDKVNMEVPAPFDGVLTKILVEEGATVPMGAIIAEMETDASNVGTGSENKVIAKEADPEIGTAGVLVESAVGLGPTGAEALESPPEGTSTADTTVVQRSYSPVVMKLARDHDVDLSKITGSGINGRVTKKDVTAYIDQKDGGEADVVLSKSGPDRPQKGQASSESDEEIIEIKPVRRMIADHMTRSSSEIPHAWGSVEVDVSDLVHLRRTVREEFRRKEGLDLTILPFVIKATAECLKENPLLNSTWRPEGIVLKKRLNIGVAIAAPDGLVVPVIHNADTLSVAGLNKALRELSDRAHQGKLTLNDVQGGTFTVNNTGALGSVMSQPIINYPQAAIMTTEAIQKRPVVINDAIAIRSIMNVCMAFDHRILDGLESSRFLQGIKRRLEDMGSDTLIY